MNIMIVAMDEQRLIGNYHHLPWSCPEDLAHFHECTHGEQLLMGRTTFEHLPNNMKQEHIYVATHNTILEKDNIQCCNDVEALLKDWKTKKEKLFICGGAQIYEAAYPYVDELLLSIVQGSHTGDTYLPDFDVSCFKEHSSEERKGFTLWHYRNRIAKKG